MTKNQIKQYILYCFDTYFKLKKIVILLIKLLLFKVKNDLLKEKQNLRFWYILTFAAGILFFFSYYFIYKHYCLVISAILLYIAYICDVFYIKKGNKILLKFLSFFILGYIIAFANYNNSEEKNFKSSEFNITFDGKIENIKLTSDENILILKPINVPNTDLFNGKIKVKYSTSLLPNQSLNNGDIVRIKTSLIPIKYSDFPQDTSYKNYAKFFDVIATGHAKSIQILEKQNTEYNFFTKFNTQNYRNNIQKRIYDVNKHAPSAGIIIAILTGNNSFIPKQQLDDIRHSGCAHILAISGLHMSIVIAFVFMIFIHLFALFPKIALRYNTKKLSILPAILVCLFYLKIANIPISATRSFIMVTIASITLLLNRKKASLNTLFITFFVMLCMSPNYLLSPSFQMSFMAVFGLITLYNNDIFAENAILSKRKTVFSYITGVILSSIIATISTVFFEIYHFKQYAWIGLLSNIPIIPITEFLVLPFGFIGMLFNATAFGDICYTIAGFFAKIVCIITNWTANLPYSFLLTKQMSDMQLCIIIFGLILLFLSHAKTLKILGILFFTIGITSYLREDRFVLVYNQNLQNIVFLEDNNYYSVNTINSAYLNNVWSQNLGVLKILPMTDKNKSIKCKGSRQEKNMSCTYTINGNNITIHQGKKQQVIGVKIKNGKPIFISNQQ